MIFTYITLVLRILSNPIANAFQKKIVQFNSATVSNFYTYALMSLCVMPFALKTNWAELPPDVYTNAFIAGLLCSTGTACLIKALQSGDLSVLGPINSYKCIIGLFTAFFLLHEIPTFLGILGMILIIFGSWFVFDATDEGFSLKLFTRRDIQLRFLALLLTGIEAAFLKKVIILSSPLISFYLWCFSGAIFSFVLIILFRKNLEKVSLKTCKYYITVALCLGIMQFSTNYIFDRMNVGFALALFQLSTLVTLFLGFKMFNEKDMKKKLIGTIIMVLGSIMILSKSFG
ncbi:EamA family transporter [bacterium]|nr:EamA family transporter [bacterium]